MPTKRRTATAGLKTIRATPAKGRAAKGAVKLGRRKAAWTRAGTAVFYGRALVGDDTARSDLRDAIASARVAYGRSSDRRGRLSATTLFEDRKARKEAGNAVAALSRALRTADRKRERPKRLGGRTIVLIGLAGSGVAVAAIKRRSHSQTESLPASGGAAT